MRARIARAISGDAGGADRALLAPAAGLYRLAAIARARAYRSGVLATRRLHRPVISVGNLTLGGTGKTPLVAALAAFLGDGGRNVVVLTRGYGRRSRVREVLRSEAGELPPDAYERGGDEPSLLARALPGVAVVVDADRHAAGLWAEVALEPDAFLLDDGYQHLRLARDLNLLVVDATDPFGGFRTPPLGRLREPIAAIARADAVVVTRADRPFDRDMIECVVRANARAEVPIIYASHEITGFRGLGGAHVLGVDELRGRRVGVITAIGNPRVFLEDLRRLGIEVVAASLWPDHHDFGCDELDAASASARDAGASALLTTEKDAVKLERLGASPLSSFAAQLRFRCDDEPLLRRLCAEVLGRWKA